MSSDACELKAGRLRVRFERRGDRYGHTILVDEQPALVSVEGGPDEAWPASPPLQEIHPQPLADGRRAIFGVGMAGRSHWSLSVTADGDRLMFEAACRAFGDRGPLGSSYQRAVSTDQPRLGLAARTELVEQAGTVRVLPSEPQTTWSWSLE